MSRRRPGSARSCEELLGENIRDEFPEAVGSTFQEKYETAIEED